MTVTHIPTISEQLEQAVTQVRRYRHHPDCACALYRGNDRAPFCTGGEATWSSILDRLIDRALLETTAIAVAAFPDQISSLLPQEEP